MKLRICDGEHESIVPASLEMVEQAFSAGTSVRIGTEITLADGARWLAALALEPPAPRPGEEPLQFLLSGGTSGRAVVTGRLGRSEVLRWFRAFSEETVDLDLSGYRRGSSIRQMSLSRSEAVK